jgi:hypothetical protein
MTHLLLRSFIRGIIQESKKDKAVFEGGNVMLGDIRAQKIEVVKVQRQRFVADMRLFFRKLDSLYRDKYGMTLYEPGAIDKLLAGPVFGGSTSVFFDLEKGEELFKTKKTKLGDIDVYIPRERYDGGKLIELLDELVGQTVIDLPEGRSIEYIGHTPESVKGHQINSLFRYNFTTSDGSPEQLNMQIDFVRARFTEEGLPHSSIVHSHGSSEIDMMSGIKGLAKIYLISILATKMSLAPGKQATPKSTPEKITISKSKDAGDFLPLLSYSTGYGFRRPRKLLGKKDEFDVYISVEATDDTILTTEEGFKSLFGVEPSPEELEMFHSYLGTLKLMKKYMGDVTRGGKPLYESVFNSLLHKCFFVEVEGEPPDDVKISLAQSTERDNFELDREVKMAIINAYIDEFPELETRRAEVDQIVEKYYNYLPIWAAARQDT